MDRIELESLWLGCPDFADVFVRGQALEPLGKVVGHHEIAEMTSELVVVFIIEALEHRYVEDSVGLLTAYLKQQGQGGWNLPVLAADGAIAQMSVKAEHRHPFHLRVRPQSFL